jgi:predicted RNA-binding protein with PUA-like domain
MTNTFRFFGRVHNLSLTLSPIISDVCGMLGSSLVWMLNYGALFQRVGLLTALSVTARYRIPLHRFAMSTRKKLSKLDQTAGAASAEAAVNTNATNLYLLKSEPHEFSIEDLKRKGREEWDGVRNYSARNYMRQMKVGDRCWFYHSSCKTPAIVGICRVVREAQPDQTALNPDHENYDAKSTPENCRWDSVLIEFDSICETPLTLKELRTQAKFNDVIAGMMLLNRSRLSVMPVTDQEWTMIEHLMQRKENKDDLLCDDQNK